VHQVHLVEVTEDRGDHSNMFSEETEEHQELLS